MVDSAEQWTLVVKGVPKKGATGYVIKNHYPRLLWWMSFFFGIFGIEALL